MLVPVQVKPQTAKQTVYQLETIGTPHNRFQFVVEPLDKSTVGAAAEIVGNGVQMVVQGLEKFAKKVWRAACRFGGPFCQTSPTDCRCQLHKVWMVGRKRAGIVIRKSLTFFFAVW